MYVACYHTLANIVSSYPNTSCPKLV